MTKPLSVAIIGGGPTGLYLANKLKDKNYDVTLFEKKSWPVDKVCGQGIMPSGFERLKKLGIKFSNSDSFQFSGISYYTNNLSLKGRFKKKAIGVERSVLSQKLLESLQNASNVTLLSELSVNDLQIKENGMVSIKTLDQDYEYEFSYVFCCDGLHSKCRDILGLTKIRSGAGRMGARVHYNISPWEDTVQVYWNQNIEAYVTPVSSSRIEVAYLWYDFTMEKGAQLEERLLAHFPELAVKLEVSKKVSDFKAYGPFKKYSSQLKFNNVFFLGDAYCFLDGITGEGVSLGFKGADIVADNFENFSKVNALHIYLLYMNYRFWIIISLQMSRFPKLRKIVIRVASLFPALFNTCLNLNDYSFKFMKRFY